MTAIEAFIVQVLSQVFAQSFLLFMQNLPTIMVAVRAANTSTLVDAPATPPDLAAQLQQEIANATK